MITKGEKYSYGDLQIIPAKITSINSRSECNCEYDVDGQKMLPLFTAPMDSVADDTNYMKFKENGIIPIIHRNVSFETRYKLMLEGEWCAFDTNEFREVFCNDTEDTSLYNRESNLSGLKVKALIDVASGHMAHLFELSNTSKNLAKKHYVELTLMSGNVANPDTWFEYCKNGIDYMRTSIGTGSMCLTTANSAVGYPIASLIDEIRTIKQEYATQQCMFDYDEKRDGLLCYAGKIRQKYPNFTETKIIADGGCRNYSDIIIALALGADYVMCGGMFAAFLESCALLKPSSQTNPDKEGYLMRIDAKNAFTEETKFFFSIPNKMKSSAIDDYVELAHKYNLDVPFGGNNTTSYIYPSPTTTIVIPYSVLFGNEDVARWVVKHISLEKSSHGMSTKEAQIGKILSRGEKVDYNKLKTSEGKTITSQVEYTIGQWTENFRHYLKNTMSYCDARSLGEFIGEVELIVKSRGTKESVNK